MTAHAQNVSAVSAVTCTASLLSLAERQLTELDYAMGEVEADCDTLDTQHSALVEQALAMPAESDADRAKQVRMLLNHVTPAAWLGADADLDWEIAMARRLLLKFAGLDPMIDPTSDE